MKGHFSTLFHYQTPFVHLRCSWQPLDLPRALRPPFQVPSVELVMGSSFSTDAVPGLGYIPLSTYFGVTHPTGVFFYTGTSLRPSLGLTTWAMLLFCFFFSSCKVEGGGRSQTWPASCFVFIDFSLVVVQCFISPNSFSQTHSLQKEKFLTCNPFCKTSVLLQYPKKGS